MVVDRVPSKQKYNVGTDQGMYTRCVTNSRTTTVIITRIHYVIITMHMCAYRN